LKGKFFTEDGIGVECIICSVMQTVLDDYHNIGGSKGKRNFRSCSRKSNSIDKYVNHYNKTL